MYSGDLPAASTRNAELPRQATAPVPEAPAVRLAAAGPGWRVVAGALIIAAVLLLSSCAEKIATGGGRVATEQDVAALWEDALSTQPTPPLVITGESTRWIGRQLTTGTFELDPDAAVPDPDNEIIDMGGARRSVRVQSASEAVADMAAERSVSCTGCTPTRLVDPTLVVLEQPTILGVTRLPAWSFRLAGSDVRLTRVAVRPSEYLTVPGLRADVVSADKSAEVLSDGRVRVTFPGLVMPASVGACGGDYLATAIERGPLVAVQIAATPNPRKPEGMTVCGSSQGPRTVDVHLSTPLGDRVLLDASTGSAIPRS